MRLPATPLRLPPLPADMLGTATHHWWEAAETDILGMFGRNWPAQRASVLDSFVWSCYYGWKRRSWRLDGGLVGNGST